MLKAKIGCLFAAALIAACSADANIVDEDNPENNIDEGGTRIIAEALGINNIGCVKVTATDTVARTVRSEELAQTTEGKRTSFTGTLRLDKGSKYDMEATAYQETCPRAKTVVASGSYQGFDGSADSLTLTLVTAGQDQLSAGIFVKSVKVRKIQNGLRLNVQLFGEADDYEDANCDVSVKCGNAEMGSNHRRIYNTEFEATVDFQQQPKQQSCIIKLTVTNNKGGKKVSHERQILFSSSSSSIDDDAAQRVNVKVIHRPQFDSLAISTARKQLCRPLDINSSDVKSSFCRDEKNRNYIFKYGQTLKLSVNLKKDSIEDSGMSLKDVKIAYQAHCANNVGKELLVEDIKSEKVEVELVLDATTVAPGSCYIRFRASYKEKSLESQKGKKAVNTETSAMIGFYVVSTNNSYLSCADYEKLGCTTSNAKLYCAAEEFNFDELNAGTTNCRSEEQTCEIECR
jgi:hypothetical protein